jgi:hypothetical protein
MPGRQPPGGPVRGGLGLKRLEERVTQIEAWIQNAGARFLQSLESGEHGAAWGPAFCEWATTSHESTKAEVVLPFSEAGVILLTPIGNASVFRVFEGGPYGEKFNVVAYDPADEQTAGVKHYFFWFAISTT